MKNFAALIPRLAVVVATAAVWWWLGYAGSESAFAAPPAPDGLQITAADDGRAVALSPGQVLEITLDANPGAGYSWDVKTVNGVLVQIGASQFKPSTPPILGRFPALGAPGKLTLRFAAVQAGSADLNLVERRPWQAATAPQDTFSLQVQAEGDFTNVLGNLLAADPESAVAPAELGATDVLGLPASFNWCDQGGCTPVRDQKSCGSCWAFGTVGPLESALLIEDGVSKDLSEQYLVSCNTRGWNCSGGWWAHDFHWRDYPAGESGAGARYESDFPYVAANAACNPPHTAREALTGWSYVTTSWEVPSVASIKQAIYDHGPVAAAVCVGSAFSGYGGGVFATNEICSGTVNHAIVLTGWNDADQVWYLRNSWGTGWGESGTMRIRWNTSNVGYAANYVTYQGSGGTGPAAPTGLNAQAVGAERVDLAWTDNSSDEDGFNIEWSTDGSVWSLIGTVGANVTTYSDTAGPFACGSTYWYRVQAYNSGGDSGFSNQSAATMTDCDGCQDEYEPDDLYDEATTLSTNGVAQQHTLHIAGDRDWARVTMTAGRPYTISTSNLGDYNDTYLHLYDRDGSTLLTSNDDYGGTLASRVVWTPTSSGDYFVMVRHYFSNYGGCSGFGYDLEAAAAPAVPTAPTNVTATDGAFTDRVHIAWNAVQGAASYKVYLATSPTGTKTLLGSVETTQLDHTSGAVNATYYYWVTACAGSACSGYSAYDSGWRAALLAPTGLQASDGAYSDKVNVTWMPVTGASSYQLYYATTATGTRTYLASVATTTVNHTAATAGTIYYYWVKACQGSSCSAYSSPDTGWRNLAAPGNVQASDGTYTDRVRVSWSPVTGGQKYEVYWTTVATGTPTLLVTVTTTAADHLSATHGVTYYYRIKACSSAGCSDFSSHNTGWRGLVAPGGVQASDGSYTDRVLISWQPAAGANAYQVYSATSATGVKTLVGTAAGTSLDDTAATAGKTYYYWVKACAGALCSTFSASDTGWRAQLAPPGAVQASDGAYSDRVKVTWSAVSGASGYRVYYGATATGSKVLVGSPPTTEFNHIAARPGTTYYYWVTACAGTVCSGYSTHDTGWRSGVRLSIVTLDVAATGGFYTDCVRISWSAPPGATVYQVQRATASQDVRESIGGTTEIAFDDLAAQPGVDYYYWVTPCNDEGCGDAGIETAGWRALVPPVDLRAIPANPGGLMQLGWSPVPGATSYEVYRAITVDEPRYSLGTTSDTSFEDSSAARGVPYVYWVSACSDVHCSDYSPPAAAATSHTTFLPVVARE